MDIHWFYIHLKENHKIKTNVDKLRTRSNFILFLKWIENCLKIVLVTCMSSDGITKDKRFRYCYEKNPHFFGFLSFAALFDQTIKWFIWWTLPISECTQSSTFQLNIFENWMVDEVSSRTFSNVKIDLVCFQIMKIVFCILCLSDCYISDGSILTNLSESTSELDNKEKWEEKLKNSLITCFYGRFFSFC